MKKKTEYQQQPLHVRAYWWLRHRPITMWCAAMIIVGWVVSGCYIKPVERKFFKTRRDYIKHLWMCGRSVAAYRMGDTFTMSEWIEELRNK